MGDRWIVSAAYGRCLDAALECGAAYARAARRYDHAQMRGDLPAAELAKLDMDAAMAEADEWSKLAHCTPRFVEVDRG